MNARALQADALLLLTALIWGGAFVAQRSAMAHVGPLTFNGLRFALGTLVVLLVIHARGRRRASDPSATRSAENRQHPVANWRWGLLAGGILLVGATLQQAGIVYTTAGKAGFITGLYVVLVPILGLLVRQRTAAATWVGAGLAAAGLYFLSITQEFEINPGDALVLACAAVWAVHVLVIGWLAPRADPLKLAAVQFAVVSLVSIAGAACYERLGPGIWDALGAIAYGGVLSVGVAYTLQVVAQRDAPPAHAGLLMSFETVVAAAAGALLLGERLAGRELLGCALMLAGILVSQFRRSPGGARQSRTGRSSAQPTDTARMIQEYKP
jgi:drug/metabolite transporter (DMT)-like permease